MKMSKIKKILYIILVLDCVTAQKRISESKCDKYEAASLYTDPSSQNPWMMQIYRSMDDGMHFTILSIGTLISEHYVLTFKDYPNQDYNSHNLFVRKAIVDREEIKPNKIFGVERVIFYQGNLSTTPFLLIQLNETISYSDHMSIFRPICLWTATTIPSSLIYSIFLEYIEMWVKIDIPLEGITEDVAEVERYYERNDFIVNRPEIFPVGLDFKLRSTLLVKHQRRNYVVGGLYIIDSETGVNFLGSYISWIESIVWPFKCGQRKIPHKPHITFGSPTYHGQFPWHVALYRVNGGRKNSHEYICGGTIINTQTILTAAHCINHDFGVLPANRLLIVAGIYDLTKYTIDTQAFPAQNITAHPKYNRDYLEYDIAIVKLSYPIKFTNYIQPICFGNTSDYINMTTGTVAGWGYDEHNKPTNVLLSATMPLQTYDDCRSSNRDFFHNFLNNYNFCAGDGSGTNTCAGDSGGAMFFEHNSAFYIRGIVSVGVALTNTGQCDISQFSLFTDVPVVYEWILKVIDEYY